MAKNTNRNLRIGWIRHRSQYYDDITGTWLKRDTLTGRILDSKRNGPWKAIRIEKPLGDLALATYDTSVSGPANSAA